jgi:superfamily II DNA or RNA helicase
MLAKKKYNKLVVENDPVPLENKPVVKTPKKKLLIQEDSPPPPPPVENKDEMFPIQPGFTRMKIESTSGSESKEKSLSELEDESEFDDEEIELESDFDKVKDDCETNKYSKDCNKFILKKELVERNSLKKEDDKPYLYPNLNDPNFNIKIAEKKEFNDTKYDGEIHKSIKEHADALANADFELSPHQAFVKNFLSFQTPYNSLLLYHGLGSGKTCSAIGVSEEMRDYLKQMGMSRRIIIVASENVQDNFRLQLFDERKLKLVDGLWNIKACTGNKLLKEINPMNMKGIPREKVISQIKALINNSYLFLGYGQFANYIIKTMHYDEEDEYEKPKFKKGEKKNPGEKNKIQALQEIDISLNKETIKRIRNEFDNRLIIIDEVHNIRITDDNENKKVAIFLEYLVKAAENLRLLFLSATPMYNSYKEIIWLLNIMNINDKRAKIETKNVFDANGNFKEKGEELLIRKATGYISFVRGENPYTFPYRVYPDEFARENTFLTKKYPIYQMNMKKIKKEDTNRIISLFLNTIGGCGSCGMCQACAYRYIIHNLRNKSFSITTKKGVTREMPNFENMESFGYTLLQNPLESLIISYPIDTLKQALDDIPQEKYSEELDEFIEPKEKEKEKEPKLIKGGENTSSQPSEKGILLDPKELTGGKGLRRMMNFIDEKSPPKKGEFEYKQSTIDKYGKIFSSELIGKFSSKIKCILDHIVSPSGEVSEGIILIYSQYIDSGLVPMALALEEMGFTRYGKDVEPLFKTRPSEVVDVRTMKPPKNKKDFMPARYSMITGDPRLSPNNDFEVKGLTNDDKQNGNIQGHKVKVVLISKAGSEGIDLKFIRQVHILEPWYNMNRIDQITGRAVRNFSHKDLPFEKRNVQIFMYGTLLTDSEEEAADLYVYRVAEYKAIQIGRVSRILKETAVDCIINHDQTNFTQEKLNANIDEEITQELSTGVIIENFKIGDAPFSSACDYMATCDYNCNPDKKIDEANLNEDTYNEKFIMTNSEKILQKIRMLMKENFFYKKEILIDLIRRPKEYPYVQIFAALTHLIEDRNETIIDKYDRTGYLVNIGDYYLFQPSELRNKNLSIFDRSVPIDYKHSMVDFQLKQDIIKPVVDMRNIQEREEIINLAGKNIIDDLKIQYELAVEFTKGPKVPRGDDDWYKHCGIVMKKLAKSGESLEELLGFLVEHILELLYFKDKVDVMNYVYSIDKPKKNSFESFSKNYFEKHTINVKKIKAIILFDFNIRKTMIINKDNIWELAEPEDELEIDNSKEGKKILNFVADDYLNKSLPNGIIGFIGYKKNSKNYIFKTKDVFLPRDTGASCIEAGKSKTLATLNKIVGSELYTKENTKIIKDEDGNVLQEAIGENELCVLQEFILRKYNKEKKDNKLWFLTPDMAILYKIYTPTLK